MARSHGGIHDIGTLAAHHTAFTGSNGERFLLFIVISSCLTILYSLSDDRYLESLFLVALFRGKTQYIQDYFEKSVQL